MNTMTVTMKIDGMTCVNCENLIQQTLEKTTGIHKAKVSYIHGDANITYDEETITITQIEEVIETLGYHIVKQRPAAGTESRDTKVDYTRVIGVGVILLSVYMMLKQLGVLNVFNSFPIAKEGMGYGMLFVIGLLTSVHCVAMCGGICLSQCSSQSSKNGGNKLAPLRPSLLYNAGRVISYTVIGGIIGAIGSVVSFSGTMKGIVQILAGVFMVIMGINMLNIFPGLRKWSVRMPRSVGKFVYSGRNSNSPFYIGLLNGLMPCGPLQAMQLYALSTGSPLKGAISMLLFSLGTVPLLFTFGAISSFLSKKFNARVMTVSAVLVILLGVAMFQNGTSLSGFNIFPSASISGQVQSNNIAVVDNGVQVVRSKITSGSYEPIVVQKGIPVKWTIQADDGTINGCNNSIIIPKLKIQKRLATGDNVIEFTPTDSTTIAFSCWMGMIRSKITVVDDLGDTENVKEANNNDGVQSSSGSCCSSGTYTPDTSEGSGVTGDAKINTDQIGVATIEDGIQKVEMKIDQNGFSPAVIVMQEGVKTEWIMNVKEKDTTFRSILFPIYSAKLDMQEGSFPVKLTPAQDIIFYTEDNSYYGYVKVVPDLNNIDEQAIQNEVGNIDPSSFYAGPESGASSCCQ